MKSVLISIQPKWCELIASGKKTIEVRKTAPKLQTPFKCYIYETKGRFVKFIKGAHTSYGYGQGKVIGEFVCDRIDKQIVFHKGITRIMIQDYKEKLYALCKEAALSIDELHDYIDKDGKDFEIIYGWHISDLKIYDKPKELGEFRKPCSSAPTARCYPDNCERCPWNAVTRPPQSWMFCEV